ncbi:hypothetical protein BGP_3947 [Beggiatoa sp. PS]|nr:hypothetical protein BGP_3947 [Beggiatoa sp. PS]
MIRKVLLVLSPTPLVFVTPLKQNIIFYQRITRLEIRDDNNNWSLIERNKIYRVGVISYLAKGKDGYTTLAKVLKERGGVNTYFDYAESFVNYVKKVGTLKNQQKLA